MERQLLDALYNVRDVRYNTLEEAMTHYTEFEILDTYLSWNGIIGYTNSIMNAISVICEGK